LYARLAEEAKQLIYDLREEHPSVGEAEVVVYSEEFKNKHHIGEFGRMTLRRGEAKFFAAPQEVDRTPRFVHDNSNLMGFAKSWARRGEASVPIEKMVSDYPYPEVIQGRNKFAQKKYEMSLFFKLLESEKAICLQNPSFSALSSLLSVMKTRQTRDPCRVKISGEESLAFNARILDFIERSEDRLVLTESEEFLTYLGTTAPVHYPPRWVRLVSNPHLDIIAGTNEFYSNFEEDRIHIGYQRWEGTISHNYLLRDVKGFRYNPESLDRFLKLDKEAVAAYFLESSEKMEVLGVDNKTIYHKPMFVDIPECVEWEEIDGVRMKVKNKELFDVDEQDSYLSKRSRSYQDFVWTPLKKKGTHWLTYSSVRPHYCDSFSIMQYAGQEVVSFGNFSYVSSLEEIVQNPKQIPYDRMAYFSSGGDIRFDRHSEKNSHEMIDHLYLIDGEPVDRWSFSTILYEMDLKKDFCVPMLPPGCTTNLQTFHCEGVNKVLFPPVIQPSSFLFPDLSSVSRYMHNVAWFGPSFRFKRTHFEMKDPSVGGSIRMDALSHAIGSVLQHQEIRTVKESVLSLSKLSTSVHAPLDLVHRYVSHMPGVALWKPDLMPKMQYCYERNINILFLGEIETGFIDGRCWSSVLIELGYKSEIKSRFPFSLEFRNFLKNNVRRVRFRNNLGIYMARIVRFAPTPSN